MTGDIDLVERLRKRVWNNPPKYEIDHLLIEAADRIEALEADVHNAHLAALVNKDLCREARDLAAALEARLQSETEAARADGAVEMREARQAVTACLPLIAAEARSLRAAQRSAKERELKTKFAVKAERYERMEFALKRLPSPPVLAQEDR